MMIDWFCSSYTPPRVNPAPSRPVNRNPPPPPSYDRPSPPQPSGYDEPAKHQPAPQTYEAAPPPAPSQVMNSWRKNENTSDNLLYWHFSWKKIKINAELKTTMNMLISGRIQKKKKAPLSWRSPSQSSFSFCKEIPHHFSCSNANK